MTHYLRYQRTIAHAVEISGFGYWTGRDVTVRFAPAPPDTGVVFVRTDLPAPNRIPALAARRIEIPRRTSLAAGSARVEMVEHILATLMGLQIDNCEVQVDQPEMPGCDGSAEPFMRLLIEAGVVEQDRRRTRLVISEVTRVGDDECWIEARPWSLPGLKLNYHLDYGAHAAIGRQTVELVLTPESFRTHLAAARTFLLADEAEWLRQRGLAGRVTTRDVLVFGDQGVVDNELRFPDECARHKALDLVGDLALGGCELWGHVAAHCSGHRLNGELVKAVLAEGHRIEALRKTA